MKTTEKIEAVLNYDATDFCVLSAEEAANKLGMLVSQLVPVLRELLAERDALKHELADLKADYSEELARVR